MICSFLCLHGVNSWLYIAVACSEYACTVDKNYYRFFFVITINKTAIFIVGGCLLHGLFEFVLTATVIVLVSPEERTGACCLRQ